MRRAGRWAYALALIAALVPAARARADGRMMLGERELLREGEPTPDHCATPGPVCDRVKTKLLSGYGYLSGHAVAAIALDPSEGIDARSGLGALRINAASAALPGGDVALLALDAVLAHAIPLRLRLSLVDMEGQFICRDAQQGTLVAPFIGIATRLCRPDGVVAADARLLTVQWDVTRSRVLTEWLRWGVSFEALANGLGYAHLLRSVMGGLFVDLRSVHYGELDAAGGTSFGGGVRLTALYRSPDWEARLATRYRMSLLAQEGALDGLSVELELKLLHNVLLTDSAVTQLGLVMSSSYAERPAGQLILLANTDRHWSGFAGLYLGWMNESPDL